MAHTAENIYYPARATKLFIMIPAWGCFSQLLKMWVATQVYILIPI